MNRYTAPVAAGAAILAALYEFYAIVTNHVPTITEAIEAGPGWLEAVLIGGAMTWLAWHFGWLDRKNNED